MEAVEARRAIVEVASGPQKGQKAVISPGSRCASAAPITPISVVPHDRAMSGEHFELRWDGTTCTVRDFDSVKGTSIDGEAGHPEGTLANGSCIKAGR